MRDSLVELANTQYLGRPVFGGTTAGAVAFDATGTYVGDGGQVERRVGADSSVRVDVDGARRLRLRARQRLRRARRRGGRPARAGLTTGRHLDGIDAGPRAADRGAVRRRRAHQPDREPPGQGGRRRHHAALGPGAVIEDIDLPKAILELQMQSTAYQAALGATARVLQPSLLDFLR